MSNASSSIRQIIRASAISGIGSAVYILVGIVKTKFMAIVLGPSGVGLFGLFQSILATSGTISAAGIGTSGVRQIAEARSDGSPERLSATRDALVRGSVLLGFTGMAAVIAFRAHIAEFAFGTIRFGGDLILLGFGVCCFVVSAAQTGLLNGMHRIGDLTRASIASSLISLPLTLALIWYYQERGIAASVALTAFSTMAASWWYQRKLDIPRVHDAGDLFGASVRKLIGLGVVLMAANLLTTGSQLLARIILTRSLGIDAAGHFQAAWSISMLYLGFALNAMGTDYFPRLTAAARDQETSNRLINEQLQVALTLTGPVILCMLIFSSLIVKLLFSAEFNDTIAILRLQLLGDVLKVASWPLAFLMPASGYGTVFLLTEFGWNATYLAMLSVGLRLWGITAAGTAFVGAYLLYFILILVLVQRMNGFSFSPLNRNLLLMYLLCVPAVFWIRQYDGIAAYGAAISMTAAASYYSFSRLSRALGGLSLSNLFKRADRS